MNQIRQLPGPEIYEGIEEMEMPEDVQGWHSQHPFFKTLIDELNPKVIIECGAWKGASIIHMASLAKEAKLYTVDTFLGGIDHELNQQVETSVLTRQHGYPVIYFQCLANIFRAGFSDRICPIPQTSVNGARLLAAHKIVADLCYIDGSHELKDCYDDLQAYWPLVRPGGVMFGDDWGFSGVRCSVWRFSQETGLELKIDSDNFWYFKKPNP